MLHGDKSRAMNVFLHCLFLTVSVQRPWLGGVGVDIGAGQLVGV